MGDKPSIAVINGPNLNLLGVREPEVYGSETWQDIERRLRKLEKLLQVELLVFQSNHEGAMIDFIQNNLNLLDGVLLNPAALTNRGYGILDALQSIGIPFIEVHLSNLYSREQWHQESLFAPYAIGQIVGFKGYGYELGLMAIARFIQEHTAKIKGGSNV